MEPWTQIKFGKAIPTVPAGTKMRVILSEDDPVYSHILGRDPEAMMSAAKQNDVKRTLRLIARAGQAERIPHVSRMKKLASWVTVLAAAVVLGVLLMSKPGPTLEERDSAEPYYWDGNGSPLGRDVMNWPNGKLPHLLLVDDDPIFALLVAAHARTQRVPLTICHGVEEMKQALSESKYDAIVLDYYLGDQLGTELAALVGPKTPVVLVSHSGVWIRDCDEWPANITKFVHKNQGVPSIFEAALTALRHDRPRMGPQAPTDRPFF